MENKPNIVISQNPTKVSERIDLYGNVIDPKTKQILILADKEEKR